MKKLRKENYGYFPYPIKWIDGKWAINYENGEILLGSEIIEINGETESLFQKLLETFINITPLTEVILLGKESGLEPIFQNITDSTMGNSKNFK